MQPAFSLAARIGALAPVLLVVAILAPAVLTAESGLPRSPRPPGVDLYFITPENAATVSSPFIVRFGLRGMGVAPAGVEKGETGHHHLLIDAELAHLDLPIPNDDRHRHFGMGQTEVELDLPAGSHTLQLVLGDHNHVPHDPPVVSERITITVE